VVDFNPYREWLHLDTSTNRPTFYQILGLSDEERDAEKIRHAADERLNTVRRVRPGPNLDVWQRLLDELTEIRRVLTDASRKLAYDESLRRGNPSGPSSAPIAAPSLNPLPPTGAAPTGASQHQAPQVEVHASPVKNLLPPSAAELAKDAAQAVGPSPKPAASPGIAAADNVAAASLGGATHAALPANHAGVSLPTPAASLAAFHPEGAPVFAPAPGAAGFPAPAPSGGAYPADPYAAAHGPAAPGWPNPALNPAGQMGQFNPAAAQYPAGQYNVPNNAQAGFPPTSAGFPGPGAAPGYVPPGYGAPPYGAPQYGAPGYGAPGYSAPGYGAPQYANPPTAAPAYGTPQYGAPGFGAGSFGAGAPQTPGYAGWQQPAAAPATTPGGWGAAAPAAYPGAPAGMPPIGTAMPVGMPVPMASVAPLHDPRAPVAAAQPAVSPFDDLSHKNEFSAPDIVPTSMAAPTPPVAGARRTNNSLPIIAVVGVGIFGVGVLAVMLSGKHGGDNPQQLANAENSPPDNASAGESTEAVPSNAAGRHSAAGQTRSQANPKAAKSTPNKTAPKPTIASKPAVAPATASPTVANADNAGTTSPAANPPAAPAEDAGKPKMTTPDMPPTDTAKPDTAKPDMTKPDMTKPDMTKPSMARPDMAANDAAMAKPEMTAPTQVGEAPAAKPVAEAAATPGAEMIKLMADAKGALAERKMDVAKEHLAKAAELARLPDHQAMVGRLQLLSSYVAQFWTGVGQGMKTLQATDELEVGATRVVIISANETEINLRAAGRNLHYTIDKLPSGVAEACFERARDMKDPVNRICKAAFHAVDPNRSTDSAKQILQQAQLAGGDVTDLLAALDDKYDVNALPAARAPAKQGHLPDSAALAQANSAVAAKYGPQIKAAKSPVQRLEVAKKLLAEAQLPMDNEAVRYAIFSEARNQASIARVAELIVQVVDEMEKWFPIDAMMFKYESLTKAAINCPPAESRAIATEALQLADLAVEAKRNDLADKLVNTGMGAAKRARDKELGKRADDKKRELQKANKEAAAAAKGAAGKPAAKDKTPAAGAAKPDAAKPDAAKPDAAKPDAKPAAAT
jgi:hypothetical protein